MISGTSEILSKSGPGNHPTITKMLQRIQEKYGIIFTKYYFSYLRIWHFENFRKFWKTYPPFFFLKNMFVFSKNIVCGDEDWKIINFPLIKSTKVWIGISYLSKTWNINLVNPPYLDPPNTYFVWFVFGTPTPKKYWYLRAFSKFLWRRVESWYFWTFFWKY